MVLTLQDVKALLEQQWRCQYKDSRKNDVLMILYNLQIDSNWNYIGREAYVVTERGAKSTVTVPIKGKVVFLPKKNTVKLTFEEGDRVEGQLLADATWCPCSGAFYLYRDADNPGKFFLEGDVDCRCGFMYDRQYLIFR